MPATDAHRLPRSVSPEHYDLTFAISLDEGSFTGEERVTVLVHEPTDELVLHAAALDIGHAALAAEGDHHPPRPARAVLDADDERVTFRLDEVVAPGSYVLHVAFSGTLGDKLHGIYRSTFTDADGYSHAIAATQFEPTDARRAFPCWDEPDRKATFSTTLVVADGFTAVSNTPIVATAALGDGRTRVDFAPTIRMSTYLVAFVVGPLEATDPVDVEGVTLRVVCVPGKRHLAGFALEIGAHALRYFAEYFGVAYPAAKLDLIALPDFAMGAMENLGAVTFRETLLLVDPQRASRVELERVADVVSHEVAHMWFGDLVTMRWWNGIWLNEAFATFMEMLCVDDFRPEWERWVSFGTSRDGAMAVDGLAATRPIEFPVRRPEEAEAMFDVLTYEKGAAVVRMLERYVGHDAFRRGIRSYIAEHRCANTETSDLWDAVERATGEPARSTMDSWIFQGGFPVVSAALAADGRSVVLSQRRFRYRVPEAVDAAVWGVPMVLRGSAGGRPVRRRVLLDGAGATVDLGGPVEWVMANEGAWGFFRVRYDAELRARLLGDLSRLDALERLALVGDTWAGVLAAEAPLAELLDLAVLLVGEDDPSVWHQLLDAVVELDRVASDEDRPALQAFVRRLAGPALARVGWSPAEGEGERRSQLRAALIRALGVLGADAEVRSRALELAAAAADPGCVDGDVAGAVVAVVAAAGGEAEYEEFLRRHRTARTPQEEVRHLYALAGFRSPALVRRTMDLALGEVRTQNAPFLVSLLLANREGGALAWGVVKERWDELLARFPDNLLDRMLEGVTALSAPELAADVRSFLEVHPLAGHERRIAQLLERLDVAVALRRREGPHLAAALRAAGEARPA